MARYVVEFKAFKTGEWYTKTVTNNIGAAVSVAKNSNYGRATRVIDTETGRYAYESEEEPDFKAVNGMVDRF